VQNETMREIVIDTETTGLDLLNGDRIVEIGAVEHVNRSLTRPDVSCYVPPQRAMPADAFAVHGLSVELLVDKPLFGAVADELLTSSAMPRLWRTMRALILPFSMPS
jgi:DNA polymerase III subunit epsilon